MSSFYAEKLDIIAALTWASVNNLLKRKRSF